jgi:hypothetical protein
MRGSYDRPGYLVFAECRAARANSNGDGTELRRRSGVKDGKATGAKPRCRIFTNLCQGSPVFVRFMLSAWKLRHGRLANG